MIIRLPKDFYLFYDGDMEIDAGCFQSNKAAIEAAEKLVTSTGKAVSVYKGIARVVPSTVVGGLTPRAADAPPEPPLRGMVWQSDEELQTGV